MTDKITIDRTVLQQALDWADSNGEQVFFAGGMKSVDAMNSWSRPIREALTAPQPAQDAVDAAIGLLSEVSRCFVCDDDLPDRLLPRIDALLMAYDAAIAAQKGQP